MYQLTKFVAWFLSPLSLAAFGGLLAVVLICRGWRRTGMTLATLSFGGLWLASTPWLAWTLAVSLEGRYPPVSVEATPEADAVLVIGGALAAAEPPQKPHVNLGSAADRIWHAGALYRAGKVRWVLLSGGNQPGQEHITPEAEAMRQLLVTVGVPDKVIRLETRSRNTRENAGYSVKLVQQVGARRVLLVTSALHMPRAMAFFQGAFQGKGVTLIPATTDAEALGNKPDPVGQWLPDAGSLAWSSRAFKEYMGLVQAWLAEGVH